MDESENYSDAQFKKMSSQQFLKKNQTHHPHDAFFKQSLQTPILAKQFFQAFLPHNIIDKLELNTLKATKASFIDQHFKALHSDMVFTVQQKDNQPSYLYLLVEHQSTPDKRIVDRVLWYCIRLLEAHRKVHPKGKLPVIYPLVYYHGHTSPYPHALDWLSVFDDPECLMRTTPSQPLRVIDAQAQPQHLIEQYDYLAIMSIIFNEIHQGNWPQAFQKLAKLIRCLRPDEQALNYLRVVAEYLNTRLPRDRMEQMMETIESADIPEPSRKAFVSYADHMLLKGFDEGIERGLNQGRIDAIIRIAQKRFGPLPENVTTQLESVARNTLDQLLETALDAETLEQWLEIGNMNAE